MKILFLSALSLLLVLANSQVEDKHEVRDFTTGSFELKYDLVPYLTTEYQIINFDSGSPSHFYCKNLAWNLDAPWFAISRPDTDTESFGHCIIGCEVAQSCLGGDFSPTGTTAFWGGTSGSVSSYTLDSDCSDPKTRRCDNLDCSGTSSYDLDIYCSEQGFCHESKCNCAPGFRGNRCLVDDAASCTKGTVSPTGSTFSPTFSESISGGLVSLDISMDVENYEGTSSASYTTIEFNGGSICDYPNAASSWTSAVDGSCVQTLSFAEKLEDIQSCFTEECYEGGVLQSPCSCNTPPCTKKYVSDISISRGYSKGTDLVTTETESSTEVQLIVEVPWVESISTSGVEVIAVPSVENNLLLKALSFDATTGKWIVSLISAVRYPWKVNGLAWFENTANSDQYPVTVSSDCSLSTTNSDLCQQEFTFELPTCNTLSTLLTLTSSAFTYDCNVADCSDIETQNAAAGTITLELSPVQNACGSATVAAVLDTITFGAFSTNTYGSSSNSFVGTVGTVFLRLEVTSNSLPVTYLGPLELVSSYTDNSGSPQTKTLTATKDTTGTGCDQDNVLCIEVPANDLLVSPLVNDDIAVVDIQLDLTYEVLFDGVPVKRSLNNIGKESTSITLVVDSQESSSIATLLFIVYFVLVFL